MPSAWVSCAASKLIYFFQSVRSLFVISFHHQCLLVARTLSAVSLTKHSMALRQSSDPISLRVHCCLLVLACSD